jgi:hypothetical protein
VKALSPELRDLLDQIFVADEFQRISMQVRASKCVCVFMCKVHMLTSNCAFMRKAGAVVQHVCVRGPSAPSGACSRARTRAR